MWTLRRTLMTLALVLAFAVQETHGREDCSKSKFPNTCLKKYHVRATHPHDRLSLSLSLSLLPRFLTSRRCFVPKVSTRPRSDRSQLRTFLISLSLSLPLSPTRTYTRARARSHTCADRLFLFLPHARPSARDEQGGKVPPNKDRVLARHANKAAKEKSAPSKRPSKPASGGGGARKKAPRRSGGLLGRFKEPAWSAELEPEDTGDSALMEKTKAGPR